MIRRLLVLAAAPLVTLAAAGPGLDRLARRLADAPRRLPEEAGMEYGLDALGGEVVRIRSRDGLRLSGRWLPADPHAPAGMDGAAAGPIDGASGAGDGLSGASPWVPDPREAVLVLHGYSGSVTPDLLEYGPFLRRTAGVLGLDFRGHGGSDNAPTTFGLNEVEDVAGALTFLGERGIRRVAIFGTSMGGITAIAAIAVLGDGRLGAADGGPDAPAANPDPPRPRIVAVVADSVTPELDIVVASRVRIPFSRFVADRAFARMARHVGGDPRETQPINVIGLMEDVPLLLVHGEDDQTVPIADGRRLAAAAPAGSRHMVVAGADHGEAHRVDQVGYERAVTGLLREAFLRGRS